MGGKIILNETIQNELKQNNSFFDSLNLNEKQKEAVLSNADVLQIIAGAGTGKTTTLVSKVKYLIEEKGVDPTKILCLSFSQKSALDLRKKLKKIDVHSSYNEKENSVRATTFHSFGYSLINNKYYNKKKWNQIFELFLKEEISNDLSLFEGFKRYFYIIFNHNSVFTTEDSKGVIRKYKRSGNPERGTTYQTMNELHEVKSWNDLKIADFLIRNNIDYRYLYNYDEEYRDGQVLQADFYLPDYDIYIDDFNVDDRKIADWLKNFNQKREYKMQLEFVEGLKKDIIILNSSKKDFLKYLEKELDNRKVEFNPMLNEEIIENLEKFFRDSYTIKQRFDDFISAFKEHNYPTEKSSHLKEIQIKKNSF